MRNQFAPRRTVRLNCVITTHDVTEILKYQHEVGEILAETDNVRAEIEELKVRIASIEELGLT
jgi:hypothetical protein